MTSYFILSLNFSERVHFGRKLALILFYSRKKGFFYFRLLPYAGYANGSWNLVVRKWALLHMKTAMFQASLRFGAVSSEVLLLAYAQARLKRCHLIYIS